MNYNCLYFCDGDWIENDKNYELTVDSFHQYKGALCVNDSLKIDIAYNNDKPYSTNLHDFIQENDLLILKSNNDTVFVKRGDKTYWFEKYGITGEHIIKSEIQNPTSSISEQSDKSYRDQYGWIKMSEISLKDFISELKFSEKKWEEIDILTTIGDAPEDWLKSVDIEYLISIIDSKEKSRCVKRSVSSYIPNPENMTIGNQAISIIESFRLNETYPNGLTVCNIYDNEKVNEIRKWWAEERRQLTK